MFAIADEADVLTGLRLSGIEGGLALEKKDVEALVSEVCNNPDIAVLLLAEACAALIPERVQSLKLSSSRPLLVEIPGTRGSNRPKDSILALIRDAIGIKV